MYIILIKNINFQNWFVVELFGQNITRPRPPEKMSSRPPAPAREKRFVTRPHPPVKNNSHPPAPARTQHRPPDARPGCPPVLQPWFRWWLCRLFGVLEFIMICNDTPSKCNACIEDYKHFLTSLAWYRKPWSIVKENLSKIMICVRKSRFF